MTFTGLDLLRRMAAFGGMTNKSLSMILAASEEVMVRGGAFFFREGDPGRSLFVIEKGEVIVTRPWLNKDVTIGRLGAGDCFGEMSLIDFQKRSATVLATVDCLAIEVPDIALRALYQADVEQYAIIMMNLGREVSRRLRKADDRLFAIQQGVVDQGFLIDESSV